MSERQSPAATTLLERVKSSERDSNSCCVHEEILCASPNEVKAFPKNSVTADIDQYETTDILNETTRNISISYQGSGNRCGHDPLSLKHYAPPSHHKKQPLALETAKERLVSWSKNPKNSTLLPAIKTCRLMREVKRQQRSESREAVTLVGQYLLHHVDLNSMTIGRQGVSPTLKEIAEATSLGIRRVHRAFRVLAEAKYIEVTKQFIKHLKEETCETVYQGISALKRMSSHFFYALGVKEPQLEKDRHYQRNKRRPLSARAKGLIDTVSGLPVVKGLEKLSELLRKSSPTKKQPTQQRRATVAQQDKERQERIRKEQALLERAKELWDQDPDRESKTISDYYKVLRSQSP